MPKLFQHSHPVVNADINSSVYLTRSLHLQVLDFPGGKVSFEAKMNFVPESKEERINCYRVLDDDGRTICGSTFLRGTVRARSPLLISINGLN
jgi:hypothetical protein